MSSAFPSGPSDSLRGMSRDRLRFLVSSRDTYGDISYFRLGLRRIYQLNHPDYIHEVLVKNPEKMHKTPMLKNNTRRIIGRGLLTSDGEFHRRQRRLVQPAFHHKRIEAYGEIMVDYTLQMLESWQTGQQLDIAHEMMELTMQIVARTLFNANISASTDDLGRAISLGIETASQRLTRPLHLPDWVPTRQNLERRRLGELLESTIMGIINERRASGEDKGDLLSMLLLAVDEADGGQMTTRQVRDEVMTLFIAGHETTANALAWTLYLLAQHPEIEQRLRDEIDQTLGTRPATIYDLQNLPYNEMVIKESMRLYPPAWVISRQTIAELTIAGYRIPKGSIILMSPYVVHHDPRYFPDPERFDPERFAAGYEDRIPRYAYFPFGGGPRICIGNNFAMMEAQLVLATIIQRCHLSLTPGANVVPQPLVTLRPASGIPMRLEMRADVPMDPIVVV